METLLHIGLSNMLLATGLAVVAAVVGSVTRRPALAHGLWLLVLLKLVTPPFVHLPILPAAATAPATDLSAAEEVIELTPEQLQGILQASQAEEAIPSNAQGMAVPEPNEETGSASAKEPGTAWTPNWQALLGGLWLAGSAGWFLLAAYRIGCFRRLLHSARPATPELCAEIQRLANRLGLRRCPEVRLVPGSVSPMLWSMGGQPLLLLPTELWERLTEEQRQTLVVHELAHLARRDHWVRGLELLATGLYWWNPVVWWARHGLREVEERCCDAWVVWALPTAARAYATALVETVDFLSEARPALPAAASGIGHVRILKRRLTMILQGKTPRALSATGYLALAALAALMLPLLPTWAQGPLTPPVLPKPPVSGEGKRADMDEHEQKKVIFQLYQLLGQLETQKAASEKPQDVDQFIAQLRKKLAEMEAKRAQLLKSKAVDDLAKKSFEIEKARSEVAAAEMRLAQAKVRLAQLEAGKDIQHEKFELYKRVKVLDQKTGESPKDKVYRLKVRTEPAPGAEKRQEAKPASSEDRMQRLEKQLGELLREVGELRKEMKKPGEPHGAVQPSKAPTAIIIRERNVDPVIQPASPPRR